MKTFKNFFRHAALAAVALFTAVACSTDVTEPYNWLDQPFAFDISYSTGEAVWDVENPEALVLNKLGIGMTGTVPYLKVKSNTYWTITVPAECDWLRLSLKAEDDFSSARTVVGGPSSETVKTDEQITNVYLKLIENKGDNQSVKLEFKFANAPAGKTYTVPIVQRGALSVEDSSLLTFLKDGFGVVNGEDTRVKFYPFSMSVRNPDGGETTKRTYEGIACAGDASGRPFSYAGSEKVYVSDENPSEEYSILTESNEIPASGGANIKIDGKGYFDIRVFNNQGKTDFQMFFGAKNEYGRYRSKDLKVWISKDGVNWTVDANANSDGSIAYEHFNPQSVNGWAVSRAKFSIVPGVSNILYFRFENTSTDTYRIDDILVEEYEGETDQIFSLIQIGSDVIGLPVNFDYTNLKNSNTKGSYWRTSALILSEESGVYKESSGDDEDVIPTVPESTASSAHVQFITGSDVSLVRTRTDSDGLNGCGLTVTSSAPKVIGMMDEDYWIWTLPVHKVTASTNVKAEFTFKETDAGPKYFYFEWAQCTEDEYAFAKKNILQFTEEEKRAFYATLDWKVYDPVTIEVPNDVDKASTSSGIPIGSASSPAGYWTGKITYSNGFAGSKGGNDVSKEIVCNFPEAMDDGYFFFRLRTSGNLSTGATNGTQFQRINKSTHNGTSYLTKFATFTFDGCGQKAEYDNEFRLLPSYGELDVVGFDKRVDLLPKYIASDNAIGAIYAGTSGNVPVTTTGNNILTGSCENDETGANVYFYSPYNASSSASASDVILSVPLTQTFDNGYLVSNSAAITTDVPVSFKTTNTMREKVSVKSAVLELELYTGKALASNMSKIEISTVNPDDLSAATTDIAGSYHYDLINNVRGEAVSLSHTITSNAITAMAVPTNKRDALKLYFGLWEGIHTLYLKIYAGAEYYLVPIEASEYKLGEVTSHDIQIDKYPHFTASDQLTGIANAEQFRQFCQDVKDGKKGSALDQYRNIDGELGFGGAVRDEDKVIDMAGVDIYNWPLCTLHENFNGGNYVIKNLVISNEERDRSADTSIALFNSIDYGYTISNITFDESCKLSINADCRKDLNFAFLMLGNKGTAMGSFNNIVNYGEMEFYSTEYGVYSLNAGAVVARATCSGSDNDAQSTIVNCKNYGKMYLHDIHQIKGGNLIHNGYIQVGGIIGINLGLIVEDCENHGEISMENINREYGSFYIGGIAGYDTDRTESNGSIQFGIIKNCRNYGKVNIGQSSEVKLFVAGISGIIGRMQWAHVADCWNYADFKVKITGADPTGKSYSGLGYSKEWPLWEDASNTSYTYPGSSQKGQTNILGYISIGGIFSFCQNNVTTGTTFVGCSNSGNIDAEINMDGNITYVDNAGISVGGIAGRTGANAYNPHFDGCTNMGNITLKSNATSAEACVGGICGLFVGNRYTTAYIPYCHGSSNNGTISFVTDNPEETVAHVGGICGGALYGSIQTCVNAGAVNNASTNEKSHTGSILGTQHRSSITQTAERTPALIMGSNAVGGSVNGVTVNKNNYIDYLYGGWEVYEPTMLLDGDGNNNNYFYNM